MLRLLHKQGWLHHGKWIPIDGPVMFSELTWYQNVSHIMNTRQVTRATHVRNRVCLRVELILKIIIIWLIIFLGFIKSKPC